MYGLFLESLKQVTRYILFDKEIKDNIYFVNILCCFIVYLLSSFSIQLHIFPIDLSKHFLVFASKHSRKTL